MIASVKPSGKIAVCVYPSGGGLYSDPSTYSYRTFINALKKKYSEDTAYKFALWYSKFAASCIYPVDRWLGKIPKIGPALVHFFRTYLYVLAPLPDKQWRVLDIFDAITPTYASTHSAEELQFWFTVFSCSEARQTAWGTTSWTAVK